MSRAPATPGLEPVLLARLRRLAQAAERLAVGGRTDPEQVVIAKMTIGRDLRRLAAEVER
jgi:hypothetical protein